MRHEGRNGDLKRVVPLDLVMSSIVASLYLVVSVGLSYLAALGLCVLVVQCGLGTADCVHPALPHVLVPPGPGRGGTTSSS